MSASVIIFYLIAAAILIGAVMAVTSTKIFRAAVFLLFSLVGIAGLYFYLDYEFIAAVQIIVYVGGIVVLIIFSIFLTHGSGGLLTRPALGRSIFSSIAVIFGCGLTVNIINSHPFTATTKVAIQPNLSEIGTQMLSTTEHGYILPFEVVSMLLLASMIGCIVIAIKIKPVEKKESELRTGILTLKNEETIIIKTEVMEAGHH